MLNKLTVAKRQRKINSPYVMPRKEVVIGVSAQDVQIRGFMTGSHVGAYP